ncbi:TonB-dependent receptor domain-containing protein [Thiohalobacter sp. COW1]|uniref:TonB-dependent receptor domain-containing protein n=1 Tax=Thiohalobacter sp. COW1 TaxID=2795687 RepID=UPI00191662B6|nr:TonB-dependent receptor [Thiohalobacter sp. COW1]
MFRTTLAAAITAASGFISPAAPAADSEEMPQVIVTATRTAQTADQSLASVTVIDRDEIERSQARSTVELLRAKAGIHISTSGGIGKTDSVFIRGTNSDHVLVLIDGVRAASATLGTFNWGNLRPDQIERIEVVRGPRASLYGSDAVGGVIQIFTRRNEGPTARIGYGGDDTREIEAGIGGGERWRYSLQAGALDTDGIRTLDQSSEKHGYDNLHAALGLDGELMPGLAMRFNLTHAHGTNELDPATGDIDYRNQAASLKLEHMTTAVWSQSLTLGYALDETDSASPTSPAVIQTKRRSASWQNDLTVFNGLFTAGIDYWVDEASKDRNGVIDENIYNSAGFVQHQFSALASDWTLGLRYDHHSEFGNETTGNIAWGHDLPTGTRVIASYGTAFKAPTVNGLFWPRSVDSFFGTTYIIQGNPDLQPEESQTAEFGLRHTFGKVRTEANLFHTDLKNLIEWSTVQTGPSTFTSSPANVRDATIRGLELIAAADWAGWNFGAGYTYLDATNDSNDEQLDRRPEHSLDLTAQRDFGRHGIGIEALARSERNDQNATTRLAGYGLVNLTYRYRPAPRWQVEARVENLFDKDYVLASSFAGDWNTLDRTLFVSVRYNGE